MDITQVELESTHLDDSGLSVYIDDGDGNIYALTIMADELVQRLKPLCVRDRPAPKLQLVH